MSEQGGSSGRSEEDVDAPVAARGRGDSAAVAGVLRAAAGPALLGLPAALAWWALAPRGQVVGQPGYLYAVGDPELLAGQDVVFAVLTAVLGLLVGIWIATAPPALVLHRAAGGLLGSAVGSVLAWQLGRLLGPAAVSTGPDARAGDPLPAPLDLHALGVLGVWPAVAATAAFALLLVLSLTRR